MGITGISAFCLCAFQLLPMHACLEVTNRAGGLTLEQSLWRITEAAQPLPTPPLLLAGILGLAWMWHKGHRALALWFAGTCVLGFAAGTSDEVFAFLWRYMPGFHYQRIPRRALVLMGVAWPLLAAAGLHGAWALLKTWGLAGRALALAFGTWLAVDLWQQAPQPPPMAKPKLELASNNTIRWLAEHAHGSRVHIWESPDRHWGCDHVTVPTGLEVLASYTPSDHRDYLPGDFDPPGFRTYLSESYRSPARFWGLLNVRYVSSLIPRDVPGFHLAARSGECPVQRCQPAKSAGTYIYENEQWMPRAFQVSRLVAVQGPSRAAFEAALDILGRPGFDPVSTAVVQIPSGEEPPPSLARFTADTDLAGIPRWGTPDASQVLDAALGGPQPRSAAVPVTVERLGAAQIAVTPERDGWVVLSEKASLYPGWKAFTNGGRAVRIHRFDGVLSGFEGHAGERVVLRYRPQHFTTGLVLLGAWLVAFAVACGWSWRRGLPSANSPSSHISCRAPE